MPHIGVQYAAYHNVKCGILESKNGHIGMQWRICSVFPVIFHAFEYVLTGIFHTFGCIVAFIFHIFGLFSTRYFTFSDFWTRTCLLALTILLYKKSAKQTVLVEYYLLWMSALCQCQIWMPPTSRDATLVRLTNGMPSWFILEHNLSNAHWGDAPECRLYRVGGTYL